VAIACKKDIPPGPHPVHMKVYRSKVACRKNIIGGGEKGEKGLVLLGWHLNIRREVGPHPNNHCSK